MHFAAAPAVAGATSSNVNGGVHLHVNVAGGSGYGDDQAFAERVAEALERNKHHFAAQIAEIMDAAHAHAARTEF
jgi:asparagine synthetase B (glutamine-hydrolysing)